MKRLALALLMVVLTVPAAGQPADAPDSDMILQAYTSRIENEDMSLTVVHLNDITTDALFSAPTKYSLRAQARMNFMFFVSGTAIRGMAIDHNTYQVMQWNDVSQESIEFQTTAVNISNFEQGTRLEPGDQFQGILSSPSRAINLRAPFGVNLGEYTVLLRLSADDVSRIQQ